jgi:hypothetical protein
MLAPSAVPTITVPSTWFEAPRSSRAESVSTSTSTSSGRGTDDETDDETGERDGKVDVHAILGNKVN